MLLEGSSFFGVTGRLHCGVRIVVFTKWPYSWWKMWMNESEISTIRSHYISWYLAKFWKCIMFRTSYTVFLFSFVSWIVFRILKSLSRKRLRVFPNDLISLPVLNEQVRMNYSQIVMHSDVYCNNFSIVNTELKSFMYLFLCIFLIPA